MEFRILGTLDVVAGDRSIELESGKQRSLLALLLLHANSVVSVDRIIDDLWGDDPPASGVNTVRYHLSKLRAALTELDPGGGELIRTRQPGYELAVDESSVDWLRFQRMADEGRRKLDGDPHAAADLLREALALWNGRALSDVQYEEFAVDPARRMEERRIQCVADRIDADLQAGGGQELIGELEGLVDEHPFRERFTGLLMRALYRAGRQADALAAFRALHTRLVDEMGLDPTVEIRELEQRILEQDPGLDAAPRTPPATLSRVVRGYELRERIGEGQYGVVYRAVQGAIGREVAIKVIRAEYVDHEELVRRFEMEAQLIARLEHPHIVPLYDYWRDTNGVFLVMRWLRGGSLADALRQGPLRAERVVAMLRQVGSALTLAHRQGVIHRDVKPGNVLLDEAGEAYLADFGIAKYLDAASSITRGRSPMTAEYASPEQLRDDPAGPWTDVYQLAVVAYEALAGEHPFAGVDLAGRLEAQLQGHVPSLVATQPGLAGRCDGVLHRATDAQAASRHSSIEDFVKAMEAALTSP